MSGDSDSDTRTRLLRQPRVRRSRRGPRRQHRGQRAAEPRSVGHSDPSRRTGRGTCGQARIQDSKYRPTRNPTGTPSRRARRFCWHSVPASVQPGLLTRPRRDGSWPLQLGGWLRHGRGCETHSFSLALLATVLPGPHLPPPTRHGASTHRQVANHLRGQPIANSRAPAMPDSRTRSDR